jgi:hypothetical protein
MYRNLLWLVWDEVSDYIKWVSTIISKHETVVDVSWKNRMSSCAVLVSKIIKFGDLTAMVTTHSHALCLLVSRLFCCKLISVINKIIKIKWKITVKAGDVEEFAIRDDGINCVLERDLCIKMWNQKLLVWNYLC